MEGGNSKSFKFIINLMKIMIYELDPRNDLFYLHEEELHVEADIPISTHYLFYRLELIAILGKSHSSDIIFRQTIDVLAWIP